MKSPWYSKDGSTLPAVSASAVRDQTGAIHVGLVNVDPNHAVTVSAKLDGVSAGSVVAARVLTAAAANAHNTFEQPAEVKPTPFAGAVMDAGSLKLVLPPKSIVMVDLR
jgi:alpha-L-arabinofuranosidase